MDFYKKIMVNPNRELSYSITKCYTDCCTIKELFIENNHVIRNYVLSRWDDYGFTAWLMDESCNDVLYDFDKTHPLYLSLYNLLGGRNEIVIDDDDTSDIDKRYMVIYKENDKIYIRFINKYLKDDCFDKFHVYIKNIGFDLRSKIDCYNLDTKLRLYLFFKEVQDYFMEEYHQMTLEEYYLLNNIINDEEHKKYVRRIHDYHHVI